MELIKGLKITNRYKATIYDSSWIAGVDYAKEYHEEENTNDNGMKEDKQLEYD